MAKQQEIQRMSIINGKVETQYEGNPLYYNKGNS